MTETIIHVVMGTSGDYSDREEWAVCAYADEALAQAHVEAATKRARELEAEICGMPYWKRQEFKGRNEFDPEGTPSVFDQTSYFVHAVPVRTALPQRANNAPNED